MPASLLFWFALGSGTAAAAIGLGLLMAHARQKHVPIAPALFHGFFAGSAFLLLLGGVIYGATGTAGGVGPWEVIALVVMFAAVVLGVTLLYLHVKTGSIPVSLGAGHGATAGVALIILFIGLVIRGYQGRPAPLDPRDERPMMGEERPAAGERELPPNVSPRTEDESPAFLPPPDPPGQLEDNRPR